MIKPVFIFFTEDMIVVMTVKKWDLLPVDVRWMTDPELSGEVTVPNVDLADEKFVFGPDEQEKAFRKLAELYAAQLTVAEA